MPEVLGGSAQRALLLSLPCLGKENLIPGSDFRMNLPGSTSVYGIHEELSGSSLSNQPCH